jgi:hypothetical protein
MLAAFVMRLRLGIFMDIEADLEFLLQQGELSR